MMKPSLIGDVFNLWHIVSASVFAIAVTFYASPEYSFFDSQWIEDGFCVSNKDVLYWNSHDVCLYGDIVLAFFLGIVYLLTKNYPGMDTCNGYSKYISFSIIGHGVGHGIVAREMRILSSQNVSLLESLDTQPRNQRYAFLFLIFWSTLLRAVMPKASNKKIFAASISAMALHNIIDEKFDFTFVQTVLLLGSGVENLLRDESEKTFEYALYSAIFSPVTIIGWVESISCSNFLIHYGGHIFYDFYIAIASIFFQLICWNRVRMNNKGLKAS